MGSGWRRLKKRALVNLLISRVSAASWVAFLLGDPRWVFSYLALVSLTYARRTFSQPHEYPVLYLLAALHVPLLTALGLEVLVGVTINLDIQYHLHGQVAKASIAPKSGIFLHCLNLCLLLLLPVVFINFTSLHFGLLSAVLTCCLYTIVFLKLVSFIQVQLLQISISLQR